MSLLDRVDQLELLALELLIAHLFLLFFISFSVHISKYLFIFRLNLRLILLGQLGYLNSLLLIALIDNSLFLLLDEDAELLLLRRHLVKLLLELDNLLLALLELGLRLAQISLQIPNLLDLKRAISHLGLLHGSQSVFRDFRPFKCIIAAFGQGDLGLLLLSQSLL